MLSDDTRNKAFEDALRQVSKGMVVADIGAGSGILSMFAARAEAKHVYSVEASDFI